jgi:hypothetical protein
LDEVNAPHEIKPNEGVDEVRFGMSVAQLVASGYMGKVERYNEITEWRTFARDESLLCYVKTNVVIAFACFENCHVREKNIIGLRDSELIAILGQPSEIGDALWVSNNQQQIPVEYEKEGLQIWFEDGKVVSVFGDGGG